MAVSLAGESSQGGGSTPSAPSLSRGKMLLFAGVMVILSCLLLEIGLRAIMAFRVGPKIMLYGTSFYRHREQDATAWHPETKVANDYGSYTKYVPNEKKYDVDEHGTSFAVSVNSHGFRGKDYTVEKKPGTIRIVTLGASSTFGYYDRDNETYPFQLEQFLNEKLHGKPEVEVINLGIPHLTSREILALFHAEVLQLNPDVVTFYEGINDASQMKEEVWEQRKIADTNSAAAQVRSKLAGVSLLRSVYRGVRDRSLAVSLFDNQIQGQMSYGKEDVARHIEGKAALFVGNVELIKKACEEKGIKLIVMRQQARSMSIGDVKGITYEDEVARVKKQLDETDRITHQEKAFLAHKVITDSLEQWAHATGTNFLNVKDLLNNDRDVLISWVHLSPRGNTMIAHALTDEIIRDLRLDTLATN